MKAGLIFLFLVKIGFSFVYFPDLNADFPVDTQQDSFQEYGNRFADFFEAPRYGCGQPMGEVEEGGMKLIVRLKRMVLNL